MNDADIDKLYDALRITVNLEAQLANFLNRSTRAGKKWAGWAASKDRSAEQKANMKAALTPLSALVKNAKLVLKDLDKATKAASKQALAKYPSGKDYRDKVLTKQLASVRTWDQDGAKFLAAMAKVVPPFQFPKGDPQGVDEKVTFESVQTYAHYFGEMQKSLAKLG